MLENYFANNEISKQESLKKNGIKQFWYQDYESSWSKSLTTKVISDMECQEEYSAHECLLCQFTGHYLSLQAYETPLI